MDTQLLGSFVAVAEELHFGRAAERTRVAQPALSRRVRRLEDELGVTLFVRDRRKVSLTAAGSAYLEEARAILERLDGAREVARQAGRGEVGHLCFGYELDEIYGDFPEIVRLYRQRFPGVTLELREMRTSEQAEALFSGEIDVGLLHSPPGVVGLETEVLSEDPLVIALPNYHPLAATRKVRLGDLAGEPFIFFPRPNSPGVHDQWTGMCRDAGFSPRIVQEAESKQSMMGLVAAGIGVAFLPTCVRILSRAGLVFKDINHPHARLATALAWSGKRETPVVQCFLEVAREASRTK